MLNTTRTSARLSTELRGAFLDRDSCVRAYDRAKREGGPPTTTRAYAALVASEQRIDTLRAQIARK